MNPLGWIVATAVLGFLLGFLLGLWIWWTPHRKFTPQRVDALLDEIHQRCDLLQVKIDTAISQIHRILK